MTLLDRVVSLLKSTSAASEATTDRNGFLSYAAETHALGMGLAAGWFVAATGETQLLGVVYGAAVYGRTRGEGQKRSEILNDIATEKHYALGGIVAGALLGTVTRIW